MEERTYTITFMNGEVLSGLRMNGNNFIAAHDFDDELLSDFNLMEVTINDGEFEYTVNNMKKIHKTKYPDGSVYFTIEEKTARELLDEEINAKIEYIAMMTEVEI